MSATTDPQPKKIKVVVALNKMGDGNVTPLLDAALKGLQGHLDLFPKLPVDLTTFEAAINAYKAPFPPRSMEAGPQKRRRKSCVVR